jgi:hypothetical protein
LKPNHWIKVVLLKYRQARYQKAEVLYAKGDFEMALVSYHRGHLARPEMEEFRLGIQKAREAIDNSIGSKFGCLLFHYRN